MLSFLPSPILYFISNSLLIINTLFCASMVSLGGIIKLILPFHFVHKNMTPIMDKFMWLWATGNGNILKLISKMQWEIQGLENLNKNSWYLVISNHLSGLDIAVQSYALRNHIPMLKFFLKKELLYVPFLGLSCWALDMPFMDRTSPAKLKKNPKLKGKDLRTTQKACKKFKTLPTSIINYVEGTRFDKAKCQRQGSPYQHLLKPKAGGIAFTLAAMGEQFSNLLNITLVYPDAPDNILREAMKGNLTKVVMKIEALPVPHIDEKAYFENKRSRVEFQRWLNDLWLQKDRQITQILLDNQTNKNDV